MKNLAIFVTLCFCLGLSIQSKSKTKSKTLVYCSEASPKIFNPQLAIDGATINATSTVIYDRLLEFKRDKIEIIPGLAESWKISKDGLRVTFNLRKGVTFHKTSYFTPTRNFNADDVIFSFMRMKDKNHPYYKVNGGSYIFFRSMGLQKLIQKIEKVNSYKIIFHLAEPNAPFLANMALATNVILSKEYADKLLKKNKKPQIDLKPIGTGPFIFKKYDRDSAIYYIKNKNYFKKPSPLDRLIFSITPDPSVRFNKLQVGECHIVSQPAITDLSTMSKDKNIKVISKLGLNVSYLAMNVEKPPLNNLLVRKAISHGLNKLSYIKAIYLGYAEKAKAPLPNIMWGYNKLLRDYEYNPKKAKALLKKAGFDKGLSLELWTLPISRPYNPNGKKMGEMMQADLAKIGIKIKIRTYKWSTFLDKSMRGEHQLIQLGWTGDNGDPDNFLGILLTCSGVQSGSNSSRWCNKNFDQLIKKARVVSQIKDRSKLYKKAQVIFKAEAPWVPIAHAKSFTAISSRVQNFTLSPLALEYFHYIDLR